MENQNDIEQLVFYGGSVKALGDGRVGGHLVIFGDADNTDLEGDFFTKDTDFGPHQTSAVLYQHGLDTKLQRRVLDPQATIKTDDIGVWVEAQLQLRDEYEKAIYQMVEAGKLGWSSGTASHLVEREQKGGSQAYYIKRWPLGLDASLTPMPAEPRTAALPLKSLQIDDIELSHEEAGEASVDVQTVNVNINVSANETTKNNVKFDEVITMTDEQKPVVESADNSEETKTAPQPVVTSPDYATKDELKNVSTGIDALSATLNQLVEQMTKSGPMKDVGYIAPDDEATKPEVKSFADFITAIYHGNTKRLSTVYKAYKDMSGETGTAGGYLVPEEFANTLLQVSAATSPILPLVTRVPVNSDTGRYPSLDQYITPTAGAGDTAYAGGVSAASTAAGGTLTETTPGFEMIQWRVNKIGGYTNVENELIADSPQSIEVLLTNLFGLAVRSKIEHYILRGTGAGEPLGILNATPAVSVTVDTDNTFAWADAVEMFSRFKSVGGSPVWVIHPGIWPDIGIFESSNGGGVFQANMQAAMGNNILGYPILQSEHLPQDDNAGCVLLADFSGYLLFERSGISIAFSEHAAFTTDKGVWRFTQRLDGQPWLKSAITLADPQGSYTVSPFVYLND